MLYPKIQQQKEAAPPPKKVSKNMSFFMSFLGLGIFQENLEFTFIINLEISKKGSPNWVPSCQTGHFFRGGRLLLLLDFRVPTLGAPPSLVAALLYSVVPLMPKSRA